MQLGAVVECSLPTVVVTGSIPGVFFSLTHVSEGDATLVS